MTEADFQNWSTCQVAGGTARTLSRIWSAGECHYLHSPHMFCRWEQVCVDISATDISETDLWALHMPNTPAPKQAAPWRWRYHSTHADSPCPHHSNSSCHIQCDLSLGSPGNSNYKPSFPSKPLAWLQLVPTWKIPTHTLPPSASLPVEPQSSTHLKTCWTTPWKPQNTLAYTHLTSNQPKLPGTHKLPKRCS